MVKTKLLFMFILFLSLSCEKVNKKKDSDSVEILSLQSSNNKRKVKANEIVTISWSSKNAKKCSLTSSGDEVLSDDFSGDQNYRVQESVVINLECEDDQTKTSKSLALDIGVTQKIDFDGGWGLDYMDGKLDGLYDIVGTGRGVRVYIIGEGVYGNHPMFEGRVLEGENLVEGGRGFPKKGWIDTIGSKCSSHETMVAGLVGSSKFGTAKDVHIIPVRANICRFGFVNGTSNISSDELDELKETLLKALQFVIDNEKKYTSGRAIVSLSLGYTRLNSAGRNLFQWTALDGKEKKDFIGKYDEQFTKKLKSFEENEILLAASAGNMLRCNGIGVTSMSDAGTPQFLAKKVNAILTVGNLVKIGNKYGSLMTSHSPDIFSPGTLLRTTVANLKDDNSIEYTDKKETGTSLSAPLLAGYAAILVEKNPGMSTAKIKKEILKNSYFRTLKVYDVNQEDMIKECTPISNTKGAVFKLQ